jgi:phage tail sheath protein FI
MSERTDLPVVPAQERVAPEGGAPVARRTLHPRQPRLVFGGTRPIEGVATEVAAFVGLAADGPFNKPILVTSWAQFKQAFGELQQGTYLGRAVHAFLNNGGRACYVVRVGIDWIFDRPPTRAALSTGRDEPEPRPTGPMPQETRPTSDAAGAARPAFQAALLALETIDEVTIVCAPDAMAALQNGWIDLMGLTGVQVALIQHCELMGDRMAVLDTPPGLGVTELGEWRRGIAAYDSKFATMYWPWIKTLDAATGTHNFMPPSGHVAGAWSRNDASRGVHVAPTNELVNGAIGVEKDSTAEQQAQLTERGINTIRAIPGKGVRISSARTMSTDVLWQELNVRRLVNYVEKSILNGTDWVASQPRDQQLRLNLEQTVSGFLSMEWRRGVLSGGSSGASFFVHCDFETTKDGAETVDVVCEIGIAPVRSSEYVVFRLSHDSNGVSIMTEDDFTEGWS